MERKEPVLKIRMLKNVVINIPNAPVIIIPHSTREIPTAHGPCAISVFDCGPDSKTHEIPLHDETALLPKRKEGMSKRRHEELCDAAYDRANKAAEANRELREAVNAYVKEGVIEIVEDPFALEYTADEDVQRDSGVVGGE